MKARESLLIAIAVRDPICAPLLPAPAHLVGRPTHRQRERRGQRRLRDCCHRRECGVPVNVVVSRHDHESGALAVDELVSETFEELASIAMLGLQLSSMIEGMERRATDQIPANDDGVRTWDWGDFARESVTIGE